MSTSVPRFRMLENGRMVQLAQSTMKRHTMLKGSVHRVYWGCASNRTDAIFAARKHRY